VAYYRDKYGKIKKRSQNAKRRAQGRAADSEKDAEKNAEKNAPGADTGKGEFNPGMVEHVRMVTSLIEGWRVSREETLGMLEKALRQHSISRRERIGYIVLWLNKNSP
jgi:hypothetical protein